MSAIFKLVLGQKVVHPDTAVAKTHGGAPSATPPNGTADPPDATTPSSSHAAPAAVPSNGTRIAPASTSAATTIAAYNRRSSPNALAARPGSPTFNNNNNNNRSAESAAGGSVKVASPASLANGANLSSSPRPSAPTRTLLLRIEGCTVAQDIRDALRDLLRCPDLPYALDEPSVASLLLLLTTHAEDESITEPTLQLLANATNVDHYPSQLESNRRTVEVTVADKRHTRDELLQMLVDAVGLLLESMSATAPFWSRYYAMVLLQRLEEFEPSKVNQALLAARGVGVILDALNESDHDNALRNEALVLLTSLTLADPELQTLLAFDNAFESLFDLVQREGGVLDGGVVVRDSLTVVHNILRSNKATQKFFREMGCASRLAALFDAVPAELMSCTVADQRRANAAPGGGGGGAASAFHLPQPTVLSEKLEGLLERAQSSDAALNILLSVSILACVLRGHDDAEEELHATQDALLRCGLLSPLTRLAFCGLAVDDATRIEAVRVLALLLDRSKRAIEEWLSLPPMITLVRSSLPYMVRVWPAPRALLSYVCETTDTTLVNAGVQLFLSALSVPACQERAVQVFLGGLVSTGDVNNPIGAAPQQNAAKSPLTQSVGGGGAYNAQSDPQCGSALARILLSPATSAVEKYYTAQVFRTLIALPAAARLSEALVRVAVPVELQQGRLEALVKAQPGWVLSPKLVPSFFNYYVSFLLFGLGGGAASQQLNTAALGSYVAAALAWTGSCPWAAAALVHESSWGDALLHQARRDGAAHLRLWAATLIARGCVVVSAATAGASDKAAKTLMGESATAAAGTALAQRFLQVVGGGAALDTILFDAQASTPAWQHPVASGLRTQAPTPYDEAFIAQVEQLVREFKGLLASVGGGTAATTLPPLSHLAPAASPPSTSAPPPPPAYASPNAASPTPPYSLSEPHHQQQQQQLPPLASASPSNMSSADYQVPSSSMLSHAPPAPSPSQQQQHNATVQQEQMAALVESLQAQLRDANAERDEHAHAAAQWRERAERSEAYIAELQQELERRAATLAAAEAEVVNLRETAAAAAAASATAAASSEVENELRENIHLLEEALHSKDEEQQQLVQSLNMMEEQLRQATSAAAAANEQRAAAVTAAAHQQKQQQAPPPPPPPPPAPQYQGPPPEMLAAMEAERAAMQQHLHDARREADHLRHSLQRLAADYQELLLMVAELNEEYTSVKGTASSCAPTPARQLSDWPSASPSVDREHNDNVAGGIPPVAVTETDLAHYRFPHMSEQAMVPVTSAVTYDVANPPTHDVPVEALENSLPAGKDEAWAATESPTAQLADIARTASALGYAEATDVLIDPTASRPSEPLVPAPAHGHAEHQGKEEQQLQQRVAMSHHEHVPPTSPPPPSPPLHRQQQMLTPHMTPQPPYHGHPPPPPLPPQQPQKQSQHLSSAAAPPPPPPPHPSHHGGLPNPLHSARPSAFLPGTRHAPRYANPAEGFFGGSQPTQPQPSPSMPPPPPPPSQPAAAWNSHAPPPPPASQNSSPVVHPHTPAPPLDGSAHPADPSQHAVHAFPADSAHANPAPSSPLPPAFQDLSPHNPPVVENEQDEAPAYNQQEHHPVDASPAFSQNGFEQQGENVLPTADDFFGADEPAFGAENVDAVPPHATADLSAAPTQEGPIATHEAVNPFNPFAHRSGSSNAEQTSARRSSIMSNSHHSLPPPPTTGPATAPPAPPPPAPPAGFKQPVSALAGNAHHLSYKAATPSHQPAMPQQESQASLPPPPAHSSEADVHGESVPAAAAPTATPPAPASTYNPFAEFQNGDDDGEDGFADLR